MIASDLVNHTIFLDSWMLAQGQAMFWASVDFILHCLGMGRV